MKKLHPFFIIGTVGMIITSLLHMFMALGLNLTESNTAFIVLYSIFGAFLSIGFGLILKNQKAVSVLE